MKLWTNVLVALVVVSLAGFVMAKQPKADKPVAGAVVSVDGTNLKIMVKGAKGAAAEEKTIATDEKTVVTRDGKPAKLADLKKGNKVSITVGTGPATKIEATSPKKAAKAGA